MSPSLLRRLPTLNRLQRVAPAPARRGSGAIRRRRWSLPEERVEELLRRLASTHALVCLEGALAQRCALLHLDTADERCHFDHLRGELPRVEVRQRQCPINGATRLEVIRYAEDGTESMAVLRIARLGTLDSHALTWLRSQLPFAPEALEASVRSEFTRLTMDDGSGALLTIDLDLAFSAGEAVVRTGRIACVTLSAPEGTRSPLSEEVLAWLGATPAAVAPWALARPLVRLERVGQPPRGAMRRSELPWVTTGIEERRRLAATRRLRRGVQRTDVAA